MGKWEADAIRRKISALEPGRNPVTCALWVVVNGTTSAWKQNGAFYASNLQDSMVDILMRSTEFDRDLYDTLVDIVDVDAVTAARICLNG